MAEGMHTHSYLKQLLACCADVEYAEPDRLLIPDALPNDPKWNVAWGLTKIGAPAAWDVTTGNAATTVCIVDSGVNYK